ncbi:beta-L-arabinofuranosidase domain-containing protein [Sediminibacillus massiliensis]|uniref:beta-L-arabinofuranosidase domain-containing protein n=1 Tax=Sediminibacillus massiliensis TaxID=1926277 RepID=UPI0009884D55|nr:beta-L-arabinofuranosidase domain-containing protein [Sediminibacillus massiliensis]
MEQAVQAIPYGKVSLLPGLFLDRARLNREYVMSLDKKDLLQNFYIEANLYEPATHVHEHWEPGHLGWESPTCPLRGHFLGHWLSAAAQLYAATNDYEAKAKADWIVEELSRCQVQNGGEWVGSIPEKYLDWIVEGKQVWAPHYTLHKTLMGLSDMHTYTGSTKALEVMDQWSNWFYRWTGDLTEEQLVDILEVETGAMMEVWANLYAVTKKKQHLELMNRYARNSLFDAVLEEKDVLTNMHANTTIPEIHGAARAYEVTGEEKWRDITLKYWKLAVTEREAYCTGSQTAGEVWTPPGQLAARLGERNQEHCVVYNMIRLADYLFRWTGEAAYQDYIERNLYNGILAQQNPSDGMITYFLPLHAGAKKKWGTPTKHFWCCHGSLVQAHTIYANLTYYQNDHGVIVSQYIPSTIEFQHDNCPVRITQTKNEQTNWGLRNTAVDSTNRPTSWASDLKMETGSDVEFTVTLRIPDWVQGQPSIKINGEQAAVPVENGFCQLTRKWANGDVIQIELPKTITASPLPDEPDTIAFLDGPIVLAGLSDEERTLYGDKEKPETMLAPDNEREWAKWLPGYRTIGQDRGLKFIPLYEVEDQHYTVYFPVKK